MEKVLVDEVASLPAGMDATGLTERVQVALGELVGAAKEGLLALSIGANRRAPVPRFTATRVHLRSSTRTAVTAVACMRTADRRGGRDSPA